MHDSPANRRCRFALIGKLCIGHGLHWFVLLLPTLVLAGLPGLCGEIVWFALGLSVAAVLESHFQIHAPRITGAVVQDRVAIRMAWFVGICLIGLFWGAQIERLIFSPHLTILGIAAAAGLSFGIALRIAAIRALGPRFVSDIRVEHVFIRHGVYAWVRHPSEIGLLLMAIGGPLLVGAPITASIGAILLLPISAWRMHREDVAWRSRSAIEAENRTFPPAEPTCPTIAHFPAASFSGPPARLPLFQLHLKYFFPRTLNGNNSLHGNGFLAPMNTTPAEKPPR